MTTNEWVKGYALGLRIGRALRDDDDTALEQIAAELDEGE